MKDKQSVSTPHFADVIKACDEEERLFTAVVLEPDVYDSQNQIYSEDVVKAACFSYNEHCGATDLQHWFVDTTKDITVVQSYVAPVDMVIGEQDVRKGTWVMTSRIDNDLIWDSCKDGTFTGWSVACSSIITEEV